MSELVEAGQVNIQGLVRIGETDQTDEIIIRNRPERAANCSNHHCRQQSLKFLCFHTFELLALKSSLPSCPGL